MKYLLLDDYREANQCTVATLGGRISLRKISGVEDYMWDVVKNYKEFCEYINKNGIPYFVTFDFDLDEKHYGGDYTSEENGLDCVDFLIQKCMDLNCEFPKWLVHSFNPVGAERMKNRIESFVAHREEITKFFS